MWQMNCKLFAQASRRRGSQSCPCLKMSTSGLQIKYSMTNVKRCRQDDFVKALITGGTVPS